MLKDIEEKTHALLLAVLRVTEATSTERIFTFFDPARDGIVTQWPDALPGRFMRHTAILGGQLVFTGSESFASALANEYGWELRELTICTVVE